MRRNGFPVEVAGFIPAPEQTQPELAAQVRALAAGMQQRAVGQPALHPLLAEMIVLLTYSVNEVNQLRAEIAALASSLDAAPELPKLDDRVESEA